MATVTYPTSGTAHMVPTPMESGSKPRPVYVPITVHPAELSPVDVSFAMETVLPEGHPFSFSFVVECTRGDSSILSTDLEEIRGYIPVTLPSQSLHHLATAALTTPDSGGCAEKTGSPRKTGDDHYGFVFGYRLIAHTGAEPIVAAAPLALGAQTLAAGPLTVHIPPEWVDEQWLELPGTLGGRKPGGSGSILPVKDMCGKYGINVLYEPGQTEVLDFDASKTYAKGTIVKTSSGGYAIAGCDVSPGGPTPRTLMLGGTDLDVTDDGSITIEDGDSPAAEGSGD